MSLQLSIALIILTHNNPIKQFSYQTDSIKSISYSMYPTLSGHFESLKISEDSILYKCSFFNGTEHSLSEKTPKELWTSLVSKFNPLDFKTKDSFARPNGSIDIHWEIVSVETNTELYRLSNFPPGSPKFKDTNEFNTLLYFELNKIRGKIGVK